jgi:hypothetical protein
VLGGVEILTKKKNKTSMNIKIIIALISLSMGFIGYLLGKAECQNELQDKTIEAEEASWKLRILQESVPVPKLNSGQICDVEYNTDSSQVLISIRPQFKAQ